MNRERAFRDMAHVGDPMFPSATILADDDMDIHGQLVVERFTPPAEDERKAIAKAMPRSEVMDRLVDLRVQNRRGSTPHLFRRRRLAAALQWAPEYLVEKRIVPNLITNSGDQYYGERAAAIGGAPAQVAAMKLGTSSTVATKTGAGAALGAYTTGSDKAIDGGFPTSALVGGARQIQFKTSWGAGVINGIALREAVIVNDLADATSTAANTYSRALFGPMTLGASDTLSITWNHNLLGA